MKKLCYVCHGLGANGIDTFIANILSEIDKSKYDISLILAVDEGAEQFNEQKVRERGISIYRTNDLQSLKRIWRHFRKLKRLFKQIKPDIVHSNMGLFDGWTCFAARLAGVSIRASHAHGLHSNSVGRTGMRAIISVIYRQVMRIMIRLNANRYCGCSVEAMRFVFGKKICQSGCAVFINNGINIGKFRNADRIQTIKKMGFDANLHRIVTVGRLVEVKNPLFIVETINELNILRKDCEFIWAGDGSMKDAIIQKAEELHISDKIKMLGTQKNINEILACCDVFILPSISEGLPLVLVEAQAANLSCVVSTGVSEDANCGKLIRIPLEEGAKKFAQTISDVLDKKIQLQIDEEKLQKFDISYTVKQLENVYEG